MALTAPSHIPHRLREFLDLLQSTRAEYQRDQARYFAVAMVYAFISLEPLLFLVVASLGLLLHSPRFAAVTEQHILRFVNTNFANDLALAIDQRLDRLQQISVPATVVSLVALMFGASVLFHELRVSFQSIWKYQAPTESGSKPLVYVKRTFREHILRFAMMGTAGLLLIGALALFAAVQSLSGLFGNAALPHNPTGSIFARFGAFVVFTLTFALLFKFLPPVRLRWRHVWLSALLCATAWMVATEVLALYGAYFRRLSIPGALGALLAITVWLNLVSQFVFYGAELCKVVASRDEQFVPGRDFTQPSDSTRTTRVERRVGEPRRRAG
jgi:membrane protein